MFELGWGNGRQSPPPRASTSYSRSGFRPRPGHTGIDPAMLLNAGQAMCDHPCPSLFPPGQYSPLKLTVDPRADADADSFGKNIQPRVPEPDETEMVNELRRDILEMRQSHAEDIQQLMDVVRSFQEQITKSIADLVATVEQRLADPEGGAGATVVQANVPQFQFQEGITPREFGAVKKPQAEFQEPRNAIFEEADGREPEPEAEQGPSSTCVSVWQPPPPTSTRESWDSDIYTSNTEFFQIASSAGPLNLSHANDEQEEAERETNLSLARSRKHPRDNREPFVARIRQETSATWGGLPPTSRPKRNKFPSPTASGETDEGRGNGQQSSTGVTTNDKSEREGVGDQLVSTVGERVESCQYSKKPTQSNILSSHVTGGWKRTEDARRRSPDIGDAPQSHDGLQLRSGRPFPRGLQRRRPRGQ